MLVFFYNENIIWDNGVIELDLLGVADLVRTHYKSEEKGGKSWANFQQFWMPVKRFFSTSYPCSWYFFPLNLHFTVSIQGNVLKTFRPILPVPAPVAEKPHKCDSCEYMSEKAVDVELHKESDLKCI